MEPASEILIYQTEDGQTHIQTVLQNESVWLSLNQMADLFQRDKSVISRHIANVFEEGELEPTAVVANFATTATDGKIYQVAYYNLDVIISVGYRVKSHRGTQFRQWATGRLREYIVKGFTMDDARLERGLAGDYFDELVERVRAIRVSERRFYQKITDIYATSVDYDPVHPTSHDFFATVQNKFHYAIHGKTAAEMIVARADATKPYMGLSNFPGKIIKRSDIGTAKNYLTEAEIGSLNRIVDQYLSFAEEQASRRRPMTMQGWIQKLHGFLTLNEREILDHKGKISAEDAAHFAQGEFEKYRKVQDTKMVSDFDRAVQALPKVIKGGKGKKKT